MRSAPSPSFPFAWTPPRWVNACFKGMQALVMFVGGVGIAVGCINLMHQVSSQLSFLGIALTPLFAYLAVAIHELGHWAGARAGGMTVYFVYVGPVQMQPLRRGLRVRWRKPESKAQGMVRAFPDPHRPIRRQLLLITLAGPIANLLAAFVLGAAGVVWITSWCGVALMGFAVLNLALAIGNLLPTERTSASDGLVILRALRIVDEDAPELILMRLNGMAIKGATVDELPLADVAKLEAMAMPMPLVHLWYSIKRHQHAEEWRQAADLQQRFDALVAEVPDASKRKLANFLASITCELRFCRAMMGLPLTEPIDQGLSDDLDWLAPSLRPRCQALAAIREGKSDLARSRLADSERWASRSIDLSLERSEKILRRAMLVELGHVT